MHLKFSVVQIKIISLFVLVCTLEACSPKLKFSRDQAAFNASAVTEKFKAVADLNDYYFELRENGFFEYYRQLFDSVKNTRYPGKYSMHNDTLVLRFYDKAGYDLLAHKAWINHNKKEIIFFDNYPGVKKTLIFN